MLQPGAGELYVLWKSLKSKLSPFCTRQHCNKWPAPLIYFSFAKAAEPIHLGFWKDVVSPTEPVLAHSQPEPVFLQWFSGLPEGLTLTRKG